MLRYSLCGFDVTGLEEMLVQSNRTLKRGKAFEEGRVQGRIVAALDGVEVLSSYSRCCDSCLERRVTSRQGGVKVEQVREAVALCRDSGIQTGMFLMFGYEGEELSDIEATVEHVKASLPDLFLTTVSYPIKSTPYYDQVASRLVRIDDWAKSTDRDLKIAGRHSRRYFQYADQLLKSEMAGLRSGTPNAEIEAARRGLRESSHEVEA